MLYITMMIIGWQNYFVWNDTQSITGLVLLVYILYTGIDRNKKTNRFIWPTMALLILTLLVPARTFLYFSLACGLLFCIERFIGKCGVLPLLIMAVISPLFSYVFTVFTFPIKLQLSQAAAFLLSLVNRDVQAVGNIIRISGNDFSVDDACMGMSMAGIGALIGVSLLFYYKQHTKTKISIVRTILFTAFLLLCLLITNILRIVLLTQFRFLPGTVMHEVIGIICFIVYFLLPALGLVKWMLKKQQLTSLNPDVGPEKDKSHIVGKTNRSTLRYQWAIYSMLVLCFCIAINKVNSKTASDKIIPGTIPELTGYHVNWVNKEILQLHAPGALIYIKGIANFYNSDHSPFICWQGSGYDFKNIKKENINGIDIYAGELQQGDHQLYTAWWFDNGGYQTIGQLDWRWRMLSGEPQFAIVNISAASKEELNTLITTVLKTKILNSCIRAVNP
ncbi:exosortase N [Terrimonas rubra]|uniref:Exosortase N n=1 Tax=Terrimonas rubra TaxID=1035890 RepID=A0ABW6A2B6_9BACT